MHKKAILLLFIAIIICTPIISDVLEVPLENFGCVIKGPVVGEINLKLCLRSNVTIYHNQKNFNFEFKKLYSEGDSEFFEDNTSFLKIYSKNKTQIPFKLFIKTGLFPKIALGRTFSHDNYSLVHYLYKANFINDKKFALKLDKSNQENHKLFLGGFPPSNTLQQQQIVKVQTIDIENGWAFYIDSLTLGKVSLPVKKYGLLSFDTESIIVNKDIYMFLKENVFKKVLEENICIESIWDHEHGAHIYCNKSPFPEFPLFYLNVNNDTEKIPVKISKQNNNWNNVNIAWNNGLNDRNYIWLDKAFLYQYELLFDYNDNSISLKFDKNLLVNNEIVKHIKVIWFFNIYLLMSFCVLLIYHKYRT